MSTATAAVPSGPGATTKLASLSVRLSRITGNRGVQQSNLFPVTTLEPAVAQELPDTVVDTSLDAESTNSAVTSSAGAGKAADRISLGTSAAARLAAAGKTI